MSDISDLIKRLQQEAKAGGLAAYRADQQVRTDLYAGEYAEHIKRILKQRMPLTADQLSPLWLNPYRKVVDERAAGLFRSPPARVLLDPTGAEVEGSKEMIEAVIDPQVLDGKLDKAARYMEAHRTVLISVVWRHNRIELDVITPELFHVTQGYPDPTCLEDAEAVVLQLAGRTSTPSKVDVAKDMIWTREGFYTVNQNGKVLESGDNPYWNLAPDGTTWGQVFPFVLCQVEDPDADIYISGGDDLVAAALHVAFTLTDTEFVERFQAYGQPVFNGVDKNQVSTMEIGPNSALALGAVGQEAFSFVTPPQTTQSRMDSLGTFLRMLAYMNDLPVDTFDDTRLPTSGTALRISRKRLGQYRTDLAKRMALIEKQLFSVMRSVRNAMVGKDKITPWNYTYRVTPVPQEIPLDLTEQDARNRERIALGLDSAVEIIMRERGVSEERAREIYAKNMADNKGAGAAPASGQPAAPPAPGGSILERMAARKAAAPAPMPPAPGMPAKGPPEPSKDAPGGKGGPTK